MGGLTRGALGTGIGTAGAFAEQLPWSCESVHTCCEQNHKMMELRATVGGPGVWPARNTCGWGQPGGPSRR